MTPRRFALSLLLSIAVAGLSATVGRPGRVVAARAQAPAAPDFVRDVQPILGAACVRCHAEGLAQGKLRLDTREGFLQGGASGKAVLAGDSANSPLYQRLVVNDPAKRMPFGADPLPPAQVETLRRWIDAGAPWPDGVVVAAVSAAPPAPPRPASPASAAATRPGGGPHLTFNKDVRPILADNCYTCHGPDR